MDIEQGDWLNTGSISTRRFVCGHCGNDISSDRGFTTRTNQHVSTPRGKIYFCHACNKPTYFTETGIQSPGQLLGGNLDHLPDDISALYGEIRNATTTNSYTASVLAGRKLLMHIAVTEGADAGKTFVEYVDYLVINGYAPPKSREWVDEIRQIGNEANHEIVIMNEQKAKKHY